MIKINAVIYLEHQYPQSDLDERYPGKTFGQKCIYIYESVVVPIKDNAYFSMKFFFKVFIVVGMLWMR
jgi:hypothetical protein